MWDDNFEIVTNENAFSSEYHERWTADVAGKNSTNACDVKVVGAAFGHTEQQAKDNLEAGMRQLIAAVEEIFK